MRTDEATSAASAAADGDGAGLFKAIMLEMNFFSSLLSLSLLRLSAVSANLCLQLAEPGSLAVCGGRREVIGNTKGHNADD